MFQGLDESQLAGAVEALLFVTDEPVGVIALADMLQVDPQEVERTLVGLRERFEREGRGIQLREVAGGWRLYTHPAYHELVEKYVLSWDTRKLSQAAMETLAIVAYLQPVTRAGVASVRGVNSDSSINSLVEKGLVREAGQSDAPGNPMLYATTRAFLEKFGLRSVRDLPDLDQYAPDDETRELIRERLSAGSEHVRIAPEAQVAVDDDPFADVSFDFDDEDGAGQLTGGGVAGGARAAQPSLADAARAVQAERAAETGEAGETDEEGLEAAAQGEGRAGASSDAALDVPASASAHKMLADAMAAGFGLVDKIDFDNLKFETDDE